MTVTEHTILKMFFFTYCILFNMLFLYDVGQYAVHLHSILNTKTKFQFYFKPVWEGSQCKHFPVLTNKHMTTATQISALKPHTYVIILHWSRYRSSAGLESCSCHRSAFSVSETSAVECRANRATEYIETIKVDNVHIAICILQGLWLLSEFSIPESYVYDAENKLGLRLGRVCLCACKRLTWFLQALWRNNYLKTFLRPGKKKK